MANKPKFIPSPLRIKELADLFKARQLRAKRKQGKPFSKTKISGIQIVKCRDLELDPQWEKDNF